MTIYEALLAASIASSAYDAETTVRALEHCFTCYEANPIVRPFADSRVKLHAFQAGINVGVATLTHKLKKDGSKWWWVPIAAKVGFHVGAGIRNGKR